ncbi:importin subunit beta-3 [Protomyces lactucae-debilis]|uniref:Importin subunit beta-3 n=1 Tax=Protomyces lactucae-debilis TaxID=2754530 RepID=A0A1Y2F1E3_PROLT|nr:importin subunit beta-3 [Protomyces lactucae-debilis]ORY77670.1 importin subunit beta-3 [Protomyces lactucae-debilis]
MSMQGDAAHALVVLLSALTSTNNQERSAAEKSLNEDWIAQRPGMLLAGLAEQTNVASEVALRAFSAVLLRRIAAKDAPSSPEGTDDTVWDVIGETAQNQVKQTLLASFVKEQEATVRHKLADLIAEISQYTESWPEIRPVLLECSRAPVSMFRESAFRVFGSAPELLGASYTPQLGETFLGGLQDPDKKVRLVAVQALSIFLITTVDQSRKAMEPLIPALMNVLPPLLEDLDSDGLTLTLNALTELVEAYPKLFRNIFANLVNFGIAVIRNKELEPSARQAALEVLVSFAEGAPGMCRKDSNYANDLVVEILALMTDLGGDDETQEWLDTEDLDLDESDANHMAAEQALDRLARKLGGKTILPPAFQWLPKLVASDDWRQRVAALMALSAIAEGCEKIMREELGRVLDMVLPSLQDVHPRVRWAACNAIGQMSTDFMGDVQEKFNDRVLAGLIPALQAPESRVSAHAAAAFVNFCESADALKLEPFLDPILERLLGLLQRPQRYVQEQAVTTIATVADAAEKKFAKYYETIMPLLVNVLRTGTGQEYRLLRGKAMECATLIALAVGKETFAPLSQELIQALGVIQTEVVSADDPQSHYLISAWGRLCKVMGDDFKPYLQAVMPPLLKSAKLKPDFRVINDEDEKEDFAEEEGWEFFPVRGQHVGIKTSTLEEKSSAVEMLVLYAAELKAAFEPYAQEVLTEIALPGLSFYYHDGVRTAAARLMPQLFNCVKVANVGNQAVLASAWRPVLSKLLDLIKSEPSVDLVRDFYQGLYETIEVLGPGSLTEQDMSALITSTESQLGDYQRRMETRAADHKAGDLDLEQDEEVLYEIELDEELLGEISKTLHVIFKQYKTSFIPQWQRLLPFVTRQAASPDASLRQWVVCVWDDLIEFCGPDSWAFKDMFLQPLANGLSDSEAEVRQAAAYGIGCAAQHGGEVFSDLVAQSLGTLFALIEAPEARSDDNIYATENACCSIAKILRFNSSKVVQPDQIIERWLSTLPVTHDEEDAPYAYRFLAELMDKKHPAIAGSLVAVVDSVAQVLGAAILTDATKAVVVRSTRQLLAALPEGQAEQLLGQLGDRRQLLMQALQ